MWFQRDATCNDVRNDAYDTSVCFSIRRVATHEMEHNTLTRHHDDQGEPTRGHRHEPGHADEERQPGHWNADTFLRCDEAGAMLEYGVLDRTPKYPNCFATTPGEGARASTPPLSVASTSYSACANGSIVTVTGRLALENDWKHYRYLADTPLAGRTISIYRKASGVTEFPATPCSRPPPRRT